MEQKYWLWIHHKNLDTRKNYCNYPRILLIEPPHDKTNKMTCVPAKTQISLGERPVWRVFTVYWGWGYTHDRRADKYPYPHYRRADTDSYPHDRNDRISVA